MSRFSGKCDLFDEIYFIGAEENDTELELFNKFKEETGGVIYQLVPVKITEYNINWLIKQEKKRYGDNYDKYPGMMLRRANDNGGYYNHGTFFKTLKQLAKNGEYYLRKEIHFDKMIDLVKYYPYITSAIASNIDSEGKRSTYVELASESYVDTRRRQCNEMGDENMFLAHYDEELKKEFIRVAKKYE